MNVTLDQFKQFAKDIAPAARAACMAKAFAQLERERVDAYILPIFQSYNFQYEGKLAERCGLSGPVKTPHDLYLVEDETLLKCYYADCDEAHRAHGFKGPIGHCPALTAENLLMETESLLMDLAKPLLGLDRNIYGENRKKLLDILIGAGLKAEGETV